MGRLPLRDQPGASPRACDDCGQPLLTAVCVLCGGVVVWWCRGVVVWWYLCGHVWFCLVFCEVIDGICSAVVGDVPMLKPLALSSSLSLLYCERVVDLRQKMKNINNESHSRMPSLCLFAGFTSRTARGSFSAASCACNCRRWGRARRTACRTCLRWPCSGSCKCVRRRGYVANTSLTVSRCVYISLCVHLCGCISMCVHLCVCICVRVCISVFVCT